MWQVLYCGKLSFPVQSWISDCILHSVKLQFPLCRIQWKPIPVFLFPDRQKHSDRKEGHGNGFNVATGLYHDCGQHLALFTLEQVIRGVEIYLFSQQRHKDICYKPESKRFFQCNTEHLCAYVIGSALVQMWQPLSLIQLQIMKGRREGTFVRMPILQGRKSWRW